MNTTGSYNIHPYSTNRQILSEIYEFFPLKHYMRGLTEIDVTKPLVLIAEYQKIKNYKISLTAWITYNVACSVKKFPYLNSYRYKKDKIITFEEIDIVVLVERKVNGEYIAVPVSIRDVGSKSILTISQEIRTAQLTEVTKDDQILDKSFKMKFFNFLPKFIRKRIIQRNVRNPHLLKKQGGLIVITSVGMYFNNYGWINDFGGLSTLNISVGSITQQLRSINNFDISQPRDILNITIAIDHDIVDGGPATRFARELINNLENGFGLLDLCDN